MPSPVQSNSLRLFRVVGIDVYLHWTWALVAIYQINRRADAYSSIGWSIAEYLTLFLIVLLHEFGHALACRQVGGRADTIMLWPLGGVAYVAPPQRPGAVLWSIAAGPLVNVALFVLLGLGLAWSGALYWGRDDASNFDHYLQTVFIINFSLLVFNLLPIYPLDGGQIARALLWFFTSRARSLMISAWLGFIGVAVLALLAFQMRSLWMGFITFFVFARCRQGLALAKVMSAMEQAPPRTNFPCPSCGAPPPNGPFWRCSKCRTTFDAYATHCVCPSCQHYEPEIQCLVCRKVLLWETWLASSTTPTIGQADRPSA